MPVKSFLYISGINEMDFSLWTLVLAVSYIERFSESASEIDRERGGEQIIHR